MAQGRPKLLLPEGMNSFSPLGRSFVSISYAWEIYAQKDTWHEHNGQEASNLGKDLLP